MNGKPKLRAVFSEKHPEDYKSIIESVVKLLAGDEEYGIPDSERIHQIDDGSCQGTLVFVIGETGYQPCDYWYVKVGYGSCSGCDTLERIRSHDCGKKPTEEQVDQYMTLALHVVQGMKKMGDDEV